MAHSDVSAVTNVLPTVNEGFTTTLASTVLAGATIVPLQSAAELTDGTVFVGIIELGSTKQQTFTGIVDSGGSRITSVKWTRGTNADHAAGVSIVDKITGTAINLLTKALSGVMTIGGVLKPSLALVSPVITSASNAALTTPKVTTSINDANGNEAIRLSIIASAANDITVTNALAGSYPAIGASGDDTNIGLNLKTKGSPSGGGLQYNGVGFRTQAQDWTRIIFGNIWTSVAVGTSAVVTGTGWTFPSNAPSFAGTSDTQNTDLRYKIYLDAGTYTFINWHGSGTNKAIIQFAIVDEGNSTTTIGSGTDTYHASVVGPVSASFSGISISNGGYYQLSYKSSTKNASSSGYVMWVFGCNIVRTA